MAITRSWEARDLAAPVLPREIAGKLPGRDLGWLAPPPAPARAKSRSRRWR